MEPSGTRHMSGMTNLVTRRQAILRPVGVRGGFWQFRELLPRPKAPVARAVPTTGDWGVHFTAGPLGWKHHEFWASGNTNPFWQILQPK